jgi:hypothetical protein
MDEEKKAQTEAIGQGVAGTVAGVIASDLLEYAKMGFQFFMVAMGAILFLCWWSGVLRLLFSGWKFK